MTESAKNEFQLSAVPGEELTRRLAYLAAQDNGSVLAGGFIKDAAALGREGSDRATQQAATAMEFLAQQEQLRQQRIAELSSRFDWLEQAAREAMIDAENDLAEILSNANRDRNGRAVFQDQDGNIRNEDGEIVDPTDVDMSEWDNDAPTWEAFEGAIEGRDLAAERLERVAEARDRWESSDQDSADLDQWDADLNDLEASILGGTSTVEPATLDTPPDSERSRHDPAAPSENPNQLVGTSVPGPTL